MEERAQIPSGALVPVRACAPMDSAQVPGPLTDDLPGLLTWCCMANPAVRLLLQVFIGQSIFKRAAMQIQRHDIGSSKCALGKLRHERFCQN